MKHPPKIFIQKSTHEYFSVNSLLEAAGLEKMLHGHSRILIKPNLVEALDPPITTPVELIKSIIMYIKQVSDAEIIVGEGTAALAYDTYHAFEALGYMQLEQIQGVSLLDLNEEPFRELKLPECNRWPTMHIPEVALDSFLLSVPVLKAHSLAGVTLTMKNMMGLVPPSKYQQGGGWKKSSFHTDMQNSIADLNRYRAPDFTILDATIGMAEAHLWGPPCSPPVELLAASNDPVAVDAYGSTLLQKDWKKIGHIQKVHQVLGQAEPVEIVEV